MVATICKVCGWRSGYGVKFCSGCGASIPGGTVPLPQERIPAVANTGRYAGFWKRFAASFIDALIISAFWATLLGLHIILKGTHIIEGSAEVISLVIVTILPMLFAWLYASVMESSPLRGTLGKLVFGIVVTDLNGNRLSFGRATGRHLGKVFSTMFFWFGHLMAAFTEKKQALHDLVASSLVVNKSAR